MAAPVREQQRKQSDQRYDYRERHEIRGHVEAFGARQPEHRVGVLGDERPLDLGFALAFGDQLADERPLAVGLRRLGDVQRDLARDAHHLALDHRQRRARCGRVTAPAPVMRRAQRRSPGQRTSTSVPPLGAPHGALRQRHRAVQARLACFLARDRHDMAVAVDHEALRELVSAVRMREFTGGVAQVRIRKVMLLARSSANLERHRGTSHRAPSPRDARALAGHAPAGAPRPGRVRTRRPRSSTPPPCPDRTQASGCRRPRAAAAG